MWRSGCMAKTQRSAIIHLILHRTVFGNSCRWPLGSAADPQRLPWKALQEPEDRWAAERSCPHEDAAWSTFTHVSLWCRRRADNVSSMVTGGLIDVTLNNYVTTSKFFNSRCGRLQANSRCTADAAEPDDVLDIFELSPAVLRIHTGCRSPVLQRPDMPNGNHQFIHLTGEHGTTLQSGQRAHATATMHRPQWRAWRVLRRVLIANANTSRHITPRACAR